MKERGWTRIQILNLEATPSNLAVNRSGSLSIWRGMSEIAQSKVGVARSPSLRSEFAIENDHKHEKEKEDDDDHV